MGNLEINFFIYCITNFVWAAIFNVWYSFLPKFYEALGASLLIIGFLTALERLCKGFFSIVGGWLADLCGRKKVIILGSLVGNLSLLLLFYALNWIWLIPAIILFWSTVGVQTPAVASLINESVKKGRRATAFSLLSILSLIPTIFTIPLGGWLVEKIGLVKTMRFSFLLSFLVGICATLTYTIFLKETLRKSKKRSERGGFALKNVFPFILGYGLLMFAVSLVAPFVIFYSTDVIGISMLEWGFIRGFFNALILLTTLIGGFISDKFGRKCAILLSFISTFFPLILLFSKNSFHVALAHIFASTLFLGMGSVTVYLFEKFKSAKVIGISDFCFTVAMFLGSLIGGWLYSLKPSYPFLLSTIVRGMGFVLCYMLI